MRALLVWLLLSASALAADVTPFYRMGDSKVFVVTATPTQYPITVPPGATSYRGLAACNQDIRIKRVDSLSETVTRTTGIRFRAGLPEVLATSNPTFISLMAMNEPQGECVFEMNYGTGN